MTSPLLLRCPGELQLLLYELIHPKLTVNFCRSLKEIRAAIPPHLFARDTTRGLLFFTRDLLMAAIAWSLASYIDPYFKGVAVRQLLTPFGAEIARWSAWLV